MIYIYIFSFLYFRWGPVPQRDLCKRCWAGVQLRSSSPKHNLLRGGKRGGVTPPSHTSAQPPQLYTYVARGSMRAGVGSVVTRDGELGLGSAFPWEDVKSIFHIFVEVEKPLVV